MEHSGVEHATGEISTDRRRMEMVWAIKLQFGVQAQCLGKCESGGDYHDVVFIGRSRRGIRKLLRHFRFAFPGPGHHDHRLDTDSSQIDGMTLERLLKGVLSHGINRSLAVVLQNNDVKHLFLRKVEAFDFAAVLMVDIS